MLYIGLQVKDKDELDILERVLKDELDMKSFVDFENDKSGLYILSHDSLSLNKSLEDFTAEEMIEYLESGSYEVI